jgi:hypothetical protein
VEFLLDEHYSQAKQKKSYTECKSLNRPIDEGFLECYIESGSKIS